MMANLQLTFTIYNYLQLLELPHYKKSCATKIALKDRQLLQCTRFLCRSEQVHTGITHIHQLVTLDM